MVAITESDVKAQMTRDRQARYCLRCPTRTAGAALCDRCARHLRQECRLAHLAIARGVNLYSGAIANLRRDEALLAEYDEWKEANADDRT